MKVTFLGTSGAVPTGERNTSALLLARDGDRLLFDCGEGTQRQMMRYRTGFDIEHVFLTHLHGDHVLGLPGLLQTMGFNGRDRPIAVHAPAGTRQQLQTLVGATGNSPGFPVRIHQLEAGDVALEREEYEVQTFRVDHRTRALGYALVEAERPGRFDREKAETELGIPPGPKYSQLHAGEPVEHEGRTIRPEEVVGPSRPGRRVVYTGDTRPTDTTVAAAREADLLVHDGTFADDHESRASETAHSTAREAARIASEAEANRLALTHVSTRYGGDDVHLAEQARDLFPDAFVARDGTPAHVPYPDSDREFELERR